MGATFKETLTDGMITALGYQHLHELLDGRGAVIALDIKASEISAEPMPT